MPFDFVWYPSEYLYRHSMDSYCIAADSHNSNEIMMGGTILRQHNIIIDLDQNLVGFAHASCNNDTN